MNTSLFNIPELNRELIPQLQHKLDNKAKPVGSLGLLESLALQVGLIQNSFSPELKNPVMLTVAADHGITAEGVSPCPVEITWQQVHNFLQRGGGIGLLSRVYGLDLWVVDAGVNYRFAPHPKLIDAKVAFGSENFRHQPAMSMENCLKAFNNGRRIVKKFAEQGTNVIGFGEMGIGNTTPASALMSVICGLPVEECVGPGAGLNSDGVQHKAKVIQEAIDKHGISELAFENLARFGGYEIATIAGGMIEAASCRMIILVDGFITTSALLVAQEMDRRVLDYCIFSHESDEQGHRKMLRYMNASAVLKLSLRLGEGTGAAIAYSVLKGAVAVLSEMTSFEEAQVYNTSHIRMETENAENGDRKPKLPETYASLTHALMNLKSLKHKQMKKNLRPIMFVGTGSDVGKSIINAGFCRIFKQDGYSPAPFKAQNMSLNSFAGTDGLELGRAQAVQAEACGIEPCSEMNPILLKPTSNQNTQVVLNGKPIGNQSAKEYFLGTDRDALFAEAMKAYYKLDSRYNPMVIEGAGSISEINLREKDIVNMRVALEVNAAVILIADIDRGGVFGSIYGTLELLPPEERALIKGILINKFRGDIDLFTEGRKMMEQITGVPVVGVVPYFRDIHVDDEDSVVIDHKSGKTKDGLVNVAVVLLRHMSNFTDFNVLERVPEINLFYTANPEEIEKADVVVIPGSKNTIADLENLRKSGLAKAILNSHQKGHAVYGICGGYQMMGREIHDPQQVEGTVTYMPGLGLLPVVTTLSAEKRTVQSTFTFRNETESCQGYEIHMGKTELLSGTPFATFSDGSADGCFLNEKTWGTYLHGVFDNLPVIRSILKGCGKETQLREFNHLEYKNKQYNKLAAHIRECCDLDYIYRVMGGGVQ